MRVILRSLFVLFVASSVANAELTAEYISIDGVGTGAVEGDLTAQGEVTLLDADGGDMWNDGDNFIYLRESDKVQGDFTATVRVVAQTEAVDGRWGKAGIRASNSLAGDSSNAQAQIAAGNGSQPGQANPVPARLAGRTLNSLPNGFEDPILDASGAEVPNDVFRTDGGVNTSWLSLSYTAADNSFVAGIAPDVDGAPGEWSYSNPRTDIETSGEGWYVGLAYSVHSDFNEGQITRADGFHGVTFDNFSLVPEPTSMTIIGLGVLGLLGVRRRR